MSHCINAFVTKEENFAKLDNYKLDHVKLPQGFILFIRSDGMDEKDHVVLEKLGDGACINTDYFGGFGMQTAECYVNSKQVPIKSEFNPINEALKLLGVKCDKNKEEDEFDALSLGRYRDHNDIGPSAPEEEEPVPESKTVYLLLANQDGTMLSHDESIGVAVDTEEEAKEYLRLAGNFFEDKIGYTHSYQKVIVVTNAKDAIREYKSKYK